MTSRERVIEAINHRMPDRVPVDLGGTVASTISATAYYRLREALGLPQKPVDILELKQFVARVDDDACKVLGVDVVPLSYPVDTNGIPTNEKQMFISPIGIPVMIGKKNRWDVLADGSVVMYPSGDKSVPPSSIMLSDGMYFDSLTNRIPDFDEDNLTPLEDYKNDFSLISDDSAEQLRQESSRIFSETDYAICGQFPGALLGDAGRITGTSLKAPKGIRKMEDWLAANVLYPEYLEAVFTMQTDVAMKNLEIYKQAVGDRIQVIFVSSADYGTQNAEMFSPEIFKRLYKPFYARINRWIHENTTWKTFYHSCGSIVNLLDDFVDMGVDILNPVQLSARGMEGEMLKNKYGDHLVFWGGGVDTQGTLAFGTPEDVRREVLERLALFSKGGGYVFNAVHNILGTTSTENIISLFDAVREFNQR